MPHRADDSFFEEKRPHSRYKDLILRYYLKPYLEKVKRLGKPIVLADLFAGPGKFDDGTEGSPLILLSAAKEISRSYPQVRVLMCEKRASLFERLVSNTAEFGAIADPRHCDCGDVIDELAKVARTSTLLLYVDPFSVPRIHHHDMARVYSAVRSNSSVELLLVLMASTVMRWSNSCLAAEASAEPLGDKLVLGEDGEIDDLMLQALWDPKGVRTTRDFASSRRHLTALAGGDYWQSIAKEIPAFDAQVRAFVKAYEAQLRRWFRVVFSYDLFSSAAESIPEYSVLFASRYPPSIDLINGAMVKAHREQRREWESVTLFGEALPPMRGSASKLQLAIRQCLMDGAMQWQALRWDVCVRHPGEFAKSEIDHEIKALLRLQTIIGAPGSRIDDEAVLRFAKS